MNPLPEALRASIGLRVDQIDTPALVIDLDAMERNITRMADFARKHQVLWRPHAKAHKCAELALWLQRAGATGACVQKTAEAEALAAGGVHDITITNEVIALPKLLRLARLAARLQAQGGRLTLAVDSADGIHRLAEAMAQAAPQARIGVLVEIDVGQGRCGVPPGEPALALTHTVARQARLHFAGLHAYQGRAQHLRSAAERRDAIAAVVQAARHTRDLITASGLAVPLVTGSGTGTLVHEAASGVFGELQAGSFLFMDESYAQNEGERAVCDAGHKSHAIDAGMPQVALLPPERALRYSSGGDEHGILTAAGRKALLPAIGRMLWLIPGHCDPTVNLHDHMIGVRGGLEHGMVERIFRVDARGALT